MSGTLSSWTAIGTQDGNFNAWTKTNGYVYVVDIDNVPDTTDYSTNETGSWVISLAGFETDHGPGASNMDHAQNLHSVVEDAGGTELYYYTDESGSWVKTNILSQATTETFKNENVAGDSNSKAMVIYTETSGGIDTIRSLHNRSGSWSSPVDVCLEGTAANQMYTSVSWLADLALNSTGLEGMFVATGLNNDLYAIRYDNGTWDANPTLVETDMVGSIRPVGVICIGDAGDFEVYYVDGSSQLCRRTFTDAGGTWGAKEVLVGSVNRIFQCYGSPVKKDWQAGDAVNSSGRRYVAILTSGGRAGVAYSDTDGNNWASEDFGYFPDNYNQISVSGQTSNNAYVFNIVDENMSGFDIRHATYTLDAPATFTPKQIFYG